MYISNDLDVYKQPLSPADAEALGPAGADAAAAFLETRSHHAETPLHRLKRLAMAHCVDEVYVKDEGCRLGLGSFKALGGAYAVVRLVMDQAERQLGRPVGLSDLAATEVRNIAAGMTVVCATDGNHGKSVALGARQMGARAVILLHESVSDARVQAIADLGARIVRVAGNYDDSVAEANRLAGERGWVVVSDTSWPGYEYIPTLVMQGYTILLREALRQMPQAPTHVFVQAGVGGIAAAVAAYLLERYGNARPAVVVVEPQGAACLFESAQKGRAVKAVASAPTIMSMLECYEPSMIAWRILSRAADGFMTVADEEAAQAMNLLARPADGDVPVVAGESGAAGMAGFIQAVGDEGLRRRLGLDAGARILIINTEGATDPGRFRELVGLSPEAVREGNRNARTTEENHNE